MGKFKKFLILCVSAAVLIFAGVQLFNLFYYRMYKGYTRYLKNYEVEAAGEVSFASGADVPGMRQVAESASLALYTNTETAEIAVFDKRSGQITYSNPPDADSDPIATNELSKAYLKSQLLVEFFTPNRRQAIYNTFEHSTSLAQHSYEGIENGIRYIYTLGDFSSATGIVPVYIKKERLESYFPNLTEDQAYRYVRGRYKEWDQNSEFYTLNDTVLTMPATLKTMEGHLTDAGYTEEDFVADMQSSGVDGAIPINFTVPLEYRLIDDCLEVSVPSRLIEEGGGGRISRIQLLRNFGSGGVGEEGYMLVPNGSGSLINFNNGKDRAANYTQFVYGMDLMTAEYVVTEETEKARLPVFGISRPGDGGDIFASIEESESLSLITAYVSGNINSYNFVYPTFILRGSDRLIMFGDMSLNAELPIVEKELYDINCRVNYYFLGREHEGYSGMANFYREKLVAEGKLAARTETGDIPFFMDIEGGARGTGYFLGTQYYKTIPMTTFPQAGDISRELYANGVLNQYVNLQGWFNGGYYHDVADKIKVTGKLGAKQGLAELDSEISGRGGKLYGEVAFQNSSWAAEGIFGFNYKMESSRYYSAGYTGSFGQTHPVANMQSSSMGYIEILYNLVSPKFIDRYIGKFSNKIQDIGLSGVTLRDLGDSLHSDKRRTERIDRDQAQNIIAAQFETLTGTGKDLMVNGGNLYALKYAGSLTGVPLSHNAFFITDAEVPFYQMVVHGYLDYAGYAINVNTTADNIDVALRLIEYGASPRYAFTYQNASLLKKTSMNHYHATTFENWKGDAAEVYRTVNTALKAVSGKTIVRHEILAGGVTKNYYENGVSITVNRSDKPFEGTGGSVPAKSYLQGAWK